MRTNLKRFPTDRSTSLLAASLVFLVLGCTPDGGEDATAEPAPRAVRVAEVASMPATETIRFPATLRSRERAGLAFLQAGYLAERRVRRGEQVEAGQLLAVLHNPALQPGVAAARGGVGEARSRLEQLDRDAERLERLVGRNLVAEDDLEQVRAQRDSARSALEQAQARLDEAVARLDEAGLRAPFAGRVADLLIEPGEFAAAGQPVMLLADAGALEAEVRLPASRAASLDRDSPVRVRRLSDGTEIRATISAVGDGAPGRTAPVVVSLSPGPGTEGWRAGEPVDIELEFSGPESVGVPLAAIISPGTGVSRVFRVQDDHAESIAVQLGRTTGEHVALFGPLEPGDRVVTAGHTQLLDGEPVRVIE